jgi:uncharacterized membrane protein
MQKKVDKQPFRKWVEVQRMLITFVIAILGYALMLVAMTYVVVFLLFSLSTNLGVLFRNLRRPCYWGVCIWALLHSFPQWFRSLKMV